MPLKPFRMPDGSIIFSGRNVIYRTPGQIDPKSIFQRHFSIQALDEEITRADELLEGIIFELPFERDELIDFSIAVSEAVRNAIAHGLRSSDRKVGINILYIPEEVLLVGITDNLGPLKIEDIRLDVVEADGQPQMDTHGRGFFIMCALTSMVAYFPDDEPGLKEMFLALVPKKRGRKKRKGKTYKFANLHTW